MSEDHVNVGEEPTGGKNLRTIKRTIGVDEVHSEVVAIENTTGETISPAVESGGNIEAIKTNTSKIPTLENGNVPVTLKTELPAGTQEIGKVTGSAVEIRDPSVPTQKLAVDAQGKIGVNSLPSIVGTVTANAGTNLNTSALVKTADLNIDGDKHLQTDVQSMPSITGTVSVNDMLRGLTDPTTGHKITKYAFTWNQDGSINTIIAYDGATYLFTLTFAWNSGNLQDVTRSV